MAKVLTLVNGIPRLTDVSTGGQSIVTLDETTTIGVGGLVASTPLTIPSSGTVDDKLNLEILRNGVIQKADTDTDTGDYTFVQVAAPFTQIQFNEGLLEDETIRFKVASTSLTVYEQSVTITVGGLTAGTAITLPAGREYNDIELQVYVNGQQARVTLDFNYVGATTPRTQITLTDDLREGELVTFRIEEL